MGSRGNRGLNPQPHSGGREGPQVREGEAGRAGPGRGGAGRGGGGGGGLASSQRSCGQLTAAAPPSSAAPAFVDNVFLNSHPFYIHSKLI